MGILDEAIREHLELKRQHGAGDSELKQLEDEAFGPPERPGSAEQAPDRLAEAPTEFMAQPETAEGQASVPGEESPLRREAPSIADLQEAPPAPSEETAPALEEPAVEEHPAMEHEAVTEPPEAEPPELEPAGPSTEERHAISEQPTELFDVEEEIAAAGPPNPTDEELVEEEIAEPRLAPTDPLAGLEVGDEVEVSVGGPALDDDDEDDEFWDERRLSDELDQALEAPADPEPELAEEGEPEEAEEPEPAEAEAASSEEDVLEETPDFLEETPEDDELWFEQKPPKDFDFDD